MAALLIGYARCSTDQQDLTAQRDGLTSLGVEPVGFQNVADAADQR